MGLFCQSGIAFRDFAGDFPGPLLVRAQAALATQIVENILGLLKHIASGAHALPLLVNRCSRGRGQRDISIAKIFVHLSLDRDALSCLQ